MNTLQKNRWKALSNRNIGDMSQRDAVKLLAVIDDIDADTRWEVVEPSWWLDMMEMHKKLHVL